MTIISTLIQIFYLLILIIVFILGLLALIGYFAEAKRSSEDSREISPYSEWIYHAGELVADMNDSAEDLKKLNNPDLKFALEEMNGAISQVLIAQQYVADLNYLTDDLDS